MTRSRPVRRFPRPAPSGVRLGKIAEAAFDAIALLDADGRIVAWNGAAARITGFRREEALGQPFASLLLGLEANDALDEAFGEVRIVGDEARLIVSVQRHGEGVIPVEMTIAPLGTPEEAWTCCVFLRDLSEQNRAEEALQASEHRFENLVETVPGMVYEFAVYSDGRMALEYVSSGCEEVFGFSAQKLTDGSLPLGALIVDEEREGFIRSIQAAVAEVSPWRWEGRAHIATGGLGWIRGESQPARRADGVMVWYGVVTNVTAAHEAQRSLEEARLFLGAVIDQMPDIVFLKDADTGRYVLFNEAGERFFGLERGQAIGQDATLLFGPEIGETINARDQLIAGGSMMNVHEIPCVSHGAPKLLLSRKLPIRAPGTDHPYLIGIATDITDAKVRERELVASNASLEERVRERTRELHTSQVEILDRLGRAAGFRDDDTGAHIHRMSRYCAAIAKEAGLDAETCELIEHAAPMHDIGKIAVPDAVLLKPGRLDDEEMAAMRLHAEIGAQMLAGGSAALIRTAEEIARTHHERWDGTGYPLGLAGPEIPLVGRISAIADVFDALTSERPYKRAWTVERAAEEIRRGAGGHFDPDLVAAFERALATIVKIQEGTIAASQIPISRAA